MTHEEKKQKWREYYYANIEKVKARKSAWRIANKQKIQTYSGSYSVRNRYKSRNYNSMRTYGISLEQQKQMYVSQNGVCAICENKFLNAKDIHVDHDHSTNKVRQLLCRKCNTGIGNLKDDTVILQRAIDYLNKWK